MATRSKVNITPAERLGPIVLGLIGATDERQGPDHGDHAAHKWMMIACCVPMLVIALALVASGTAGPGVTWQSAGPSWRR